MPVARRHPVRDFIGFVATDKGIVEKPLLYGRYSAADPVIAGRQEADERNHDKTRVEVTSPTLTVNSAIVLSPWPKRNRRPQSDHVETRDSADTNLILQARDPGHDRTVVEPEHDFGSHCHAAVLADNDPDEVRDNPAYRHEVDQRNPPVGGSQICFKDKRAIPDLRRGARSAGAITHPPCSGEPSIAAKQAPASNRGHHSQSRDPSRPTSAAVSPSPMMA
jgi:hypothetical protein